MAFRKRSAYGRSRSSYTRRYSRQSYRSKTRGGQYKAAQQGRSSDRTVIKVQTTQTITVPKNNTGSRLPPGETVYCLPVYLLLQSTRVFQVQRDMYDQFHVDGIKITLRPQSAIADAGSTFQLITAFDRNGVYNNYMSLTELSQYSSKRDVWQYVNQMKPITNTIFASTITEKSFYLPTDISFEQKFTDMAGLNPPQADTGKQYGLTDANILSSWCPTYLIGLKTLPTPEAGDATFSFTIDMAFWVTYRGQRILGMGDNATNVPVLTAPAQASDVAVGKQFFR